MSYRLPRHLRGQDARWPALLFPCAAIAIAVAAAVVASGGIPSGTTGA